MLTVAVSTRYNIDSDADARNGTIGLQFSEDGEATYTTKAGDTVTMTAVAGQEIETGPLVSVGTVPSGTIGIVGR